MRPRPRWRRSSAPSRATPRTPRRCCASSATTAAPRMARSSATSASTEPGAARPRLLPVLDQDGERLVDHAKAAWDAALELGEKHGFRNAQATVIAPTGTIGLVMDCDTTGIEPDFALVKFKKLAGGGYFKIINRAVPEALRALGYGEARDRRDRAPMRSATARSARRPAINVATLQSARLHRREDRRRSRRTSTPPSTSSSCSTAGRSARTS